MASPLQYDEEMPTAAELAGAKVKHSAEELDEGETMILTLGAPCCAVPLSCRAVLPAVLCSVPGRDTMDAL